MDCSLFYNINGNNLANEKLKRHGEFNSIMAKVTSSPLDEDMMNQLNGIIDSCDNNEDRLLLLLSIPATKSSIYNCLLIFNIIVFNIGKNCNSDCKFYQVIYNCLNKFEYVIKSNQELLNDEKINRVISSIGHIVKTIERLCNGQTGDYAYYLSPKTLHSVSHMHESQGINISDVKIKSSTSPDGKFTSVDVSQGINPSEYLIDLLNEKDDNYFAHKIKFLYDYLVSLKGNFDDTNTNTFIEVLNYAFSKVIDDITGKEILIDIISKCDQLLSNTIPTDTKYMDNIEIILSTFNKITEIINTEYSCGTTSLLDEMGLGYIYDILPQNECSITEDTIDNIVNYLNESANNYDMVSILNESIKDNIKKYREKRKERKEKDNEFKEKKKQEEYDIYDETRDSRVDISRRKQNDDYDLEKDKTRDKYDDKHELTKKIVDDTYGDHRQRRDDKYELKQQKKQDKYDFKRQKKLDKYEQKKSITEEDRQTKLDNNEQKRQERAETRQRKRDETKIGLSRWKTLELTNSNARKAANALRKVVKTGAVAGTAALTGLNPIFAGSTYLISSYVKDKSNPMKERRKYVDELRHQIVELDEKINMADQRGESDKKLALIKMKQKIETALKRCGHLEKFEDDM